MLKHTGTHTPPQGTNKCKKERKKHNLQLNASAQKSDILGLGMALHTFDPSPQEAKAERSLRIQSQPALQS